ncbi:MAG: DUF4190 domain-containing protein [Sedimentisphaerales bacterium]|nr:DUF4190 domain-containing protein [Sedimentisphaerales bacterium]
MQPEIQNEMNRETGNQYIEKKTSGLAVASLVLGIIGILLGPLALIGLILGVAALIQIIRHPQRLQGQGLAIAGMCVSLAALVLFSLFISAITMFIPAMGRARELANQVKCATQLNGIGKAIALYQNDFGGACPPDLQTLMATEDLVPDMFICPSIEIAEPVTGAKEELEARGQVWSLDNQGVMWVYFPEGISFAYRGADLTMNDPADMIVAYDKAGNHPDGRRNVLFLDSHVKKMEEKELLELIDKDNEIRRQQGKVEIEVQ